MDAVTSFVAIVSLLLALGAAGGTAEGQAEVNSTTETRTTSSNARLPGGCDEWGCGMNHNETMVRDAAR